MSLVKPKLKFFASHCSCDLKIDLKEDTQPSVGPICSLWASKQEALKKFMKKNLNTGFI